MKYKKPKRAETEETEIEKDEIGKNENQSSLGFRKTRIIAEISCGVATIITVILITVILCCN